MAGSDIQADRNTTEDKGSIEGLALSLSGGYATDVPFYEEDYGLANVASMRAV